MKKVIYLVLTVVLISTLFCGCVENDGTQRAEQDYQATVMEQAADAVGMPNITNFYEKKMAKEIIEARDDSELICYVYVYSDMLALYTYKGRCMGYGLPYSTQYTNPSKITREYGEGYIVEQSDPNGLYSSTSTAATWLMMIDETTGETHPSYNEPNMTVEAYKLPARLCVQSTLPEDY